MTARPAARCPLPARPADAAPALRRRCRGADRRRPPDPAAQPPAPRPRRGRHGTGTAATGLPIPTDYVIGPDDVLGIVFWRDADMTQDVTVRPDGNITLPLLGDIKAAGLKPTSCATRSRSRRQVHRGPERHRGGAPDQQPQRVHHRRRHPPGPYPVSGQMTVLQLITVAGGLTEFADGKNIRILRVENGQTASLQVQLQRGHGRQEAGTEHRAQAGRHGDGQAVATDVHILMRTFTSLGLVILALLPAARRGAGPVPSRARRPRSSAATTDETRSTQSLDFSLDLLGGYDQNDSEEFQIVNPDAPPVFLDSSSTATVNAGLAYSRVNRHARPRRDASTAARSFYGGGTVQDIGPSQNFNGGTDLGRRRSAARRGSRRRSASSTTRSIPSAPSSRSPATSRSTSCRGRRHRASRRSTPSRSDTHHSASSSGLGAATRSTAPTATRRSIYTGDEGYRRHELARAPTSGWSRQLQRTTALTRDLRLLERRVRRR